MADPATREEYDALIKRHNKITGHGVNVTIHTPCPFCAAPANRKFRLLDMEAETSKVATCDACARSWKMIYTHGPDGSTSFEIVQTGGADPPAYLPPMRRVP